MSEPKAIYYDPTRDADEQLVFPRGDAGPVIVALEGEWTTTTEVWIGPNSHCALVHHGVADALNALPQSEGRAGSGRDLLVPPSASEAVAHIFYEADRKTYGATYDFLAVAQDLPRPVHYRVAIDNREYQQTLSQLQFMSTTAARHGHGLRIRI